MWLVFHGGVYSTNIGSHVIVQVYRNNTLEIITGRLALREGPRRSRQQPGRCARSDPREDHGQPNDQIHEAHKKLKPGSNPIC